MRPELRPDATREYLRGALWAYPAAAIVLAFALGSVLTAVEVPRDSWFDRMLFQGTADDARSLLTTISGTMMTVIALVLGLTLVALTLSSTQFSPRILRNFLRDRPTQVVLSVFVATFTYATAGLYTVGIDRGERVDSYPRLAVTLAIVLLFASLMALIYFVHHITHSIQVDEVITRIEHRTLRVIEHDLVTKGIITEEPPEPPAWAVPVPSYSSGYVQAVHPGVLRSAAHDADVHASITPMVGEHIVQGAPLVWVWRDESGPAPDAGAFFHAAHDAVRIGFERTAEQDVAFGIRQLTDVACKALSPAINDPYTAIQALEHTSGVLTALVQRPLGSHVLTDDDGTTRVTVHGRDLEYFIELALGQIRRYGKHEPRVMRALFRVLRTLGRACIDDHGRDVIARHVRLTLEAASDGIEQPGDLAPVVEHGEAVLSELEAARGSDRANP